MELLCYAYQQYQTWEAICVDLDIAVFGSSRDEVMRSLRDAVDLHLEAVAELPVEERQAMLARRSPLHVRLSLWLLSWLHGLWNKLGQGRQPRRQSFLMQPEVAVFGLAAQPPNAPNTTTPLPQYHYPNTTTEIAACSSRIAA